MNKKSRPTGQYIQENREVMGKQIRAFREKKGFSQDELAEIMEDFDISVQEKQGR